MELRPDSFSDLVFQTRIDKVVPFSASKTRTFLVRAIIPNPEWALLPGMLTKASFSLNTEISDSALQVPVDAVVRKIDGSALVWTVVPSQKRYIAKPIAVHLRRIEGGQIEVDSEELKPGDPVVIFGNESLRAGQFVSVNTPG